jgi:Na+-driven multidrug efflux pump
VFVFALLAVVGRRVAGWFNPDMQVTDTAYWYFALVGGTFGVRGIYFVFSACLNSLNRASWATVLTVVKGGVVNIPISWFLGQRYGVVGIFAGIAAGNVIGSLLATVLLRRALASETVPAVG